MSGMILKVLDEVMGAFNYIIWELTVTLSYYLG